METSSGEPNTLIVLTFPNPDLLNRIQMNGGKRLAEEQMNSGELIQSLPIKLMASA
jgi:hypothetical protein